MNTYPLIINDLKENIFFLRLILFCAKLQILMFYQIFWNKIDVCISFIFTVYTSFPLLFSETYFNLIELKKKKPKPQKKLLFLVENDSHFQTLIPAEPLSFGRKSKLKQKLFWSKVSCLAWLSVRVNA